MSNLISCDGPDCPVTRKPMAEHELQAAMADAWDAGYDAGDPYQRRGNPDEGKAANPYRTPEQASDLALQQLRDRLTRPTQEDTRP